MSTIDLTRFHATFFAESVESLDATEAGLMKIEQGERDPEVLNSVFRAVHSIKGSGGSLGFELIADFAHHMETLLDRVRKGRQAADSALVDLLLGCVDCLRAMLLAARDGTGADSGAAAALRERLLKAIVAPGNAAPRAAPRPVSESTYSIRFRPHRELFQSGNDPLRLLQTLAPLGELHVSADAAELPAAGGFDPELCYLSWQLTLTTKAARSEIEDIFDWVSDCCDLDDRGERRRIRRRGRVGRCAGGCPCVR